MPTNLEQLIERSTASFRQALTEQLRDQLGERAGRADDWTGFDPVGAGQRAATTVTAGQAWSTLAGPFTDSVGAAAALGGITKQAVSQRVASGSILGLRLAATGSGRDRLVYPTWQFHPTVLTHLPLVLASAGWDPGRSVTGWSIAAWLTTPDPDHDQLTPVQLLRAGQVDAVLAAASQVAESLGTAERAAHDGDRRSPRRSPRSRRAA